MSQKTVGTLQKSIEDRAERLAIKEANATVDVLNKCLEHVDNDARIKFNIYNNQCVVFPADGKERNYTEVHLSPHLFRRFLSEQLRAMLTPHHVEQETHRLLTLIDQVQEIADNQQSQ